MWFIEKVEITGGFLPGLSVQLPQGLTCIIGPRGSGKSTLAEAIRFAVCGLSAAPKHCVDLVQANLAGGALVTIAALAEDVGRYTIKRGLKQQPVLLAPGGRTVDSVDIDRGTFLPLDAYSSPEIEAIADEVLGQKRRALLDELRSEQMRTIHLSLAESARALDANADLIRTTQRSIQDLTEQAEELGDVRARLNALPPSDHESTAEFVRVSRQQQLNQRETTVRSGGIFAILSRCAMLRSCWRSALSMSITQPSGAGCRITARSWSSDCEGISSRPTSPGEWTKPTFA